MISKCLLKGGRFCASCKCRSCRLHLMLQKESPYVNVAKKSQIYDLKRFFWAKTFLMPLKLF